MPPAPAKIASMPSQNSRTSSNPAVPPPPVFVAPLGSVPTGWFAGCWFAGFWFAGFWFAGFWFAGFWFAGCWFAGGGSATGGGGLAAGGGGFGAGAAAPDVVALGAGLPGALLEVVAPDVPLTETVGTGGLFPPGENVGGPGGGAPPVQADTDTVASMAKAAQPRTVPAKRRRP